VEPAETTTFQEERFVIVVINKRIKVIQMDCHPIWQDIMLRKMNYVRMPWQENKYLA